MKFCTRLSNGCAKTQMLTSSKQKQCGEAGMIFRTCCSTRISGDGAFLELFRQKERPQRQARRMRNNEKRQRNLLKAKAAANDSQVWMGQSLTYDCVNDCVKAVPQNALPEAMIEWGVDAYEWRTLCMQEARVKECVSGNHEGEKREGETDVAFRTTRFCPEVGCSTFDDLIYDETEKVYDSAQFSHSKGDHRTFSRGPIAFCSDSEDTRRASIANSRTATWKKRKFVEWECCFTTQDSDYDVDETRREDRQVRRIRMQMKHEIDRDMKLVEVVVFRERLSSSAVALAEDYLEDNISKASKLDRQTLAAAACFTGEPIPLQGQVPVFMIPCEAFAATCIEGGVAHMTAGCRLADRNELACWARSYDLATSKLLDVQYIMLGDSA